MGLTLVDSSVVIGWIYADDARWRDVSVSGAEVHVVAGPTSP
jgi:hypothetical protein